MKSTIFLTILPCLAVGAWAALPDASPAWNGAERACPDQVATDTDLLACRQDNGEMRRDLASAGSPLTIAGRAYDKGIGTRTTSMLPVTIPEGARALKGVCGVDDAASGNGSVEFRVMSGSSILWKSPAMKRGAAAERFRVACPPGATKLYLMARAAGDGRAVDADWVQLEWEMGSAAQNKPGTAPSETGAGEPSSRKTAATDASARVVLKGEQFGLVPGSNDASEAMRRLLDAARGQTAPVTVVLRKGTYHFHASEALEMSYYVSNHDQPEIRPVGVPLVDLRNVSMDGRGSVFVFHGKMSPLLIMDAERVTLANIAVDNDRPYYGEATITDNDDGSTEVTIDAKRYPYEIKGGKFHNKGEGWSEGISCAMAFKKDTLHIAPNTHDIGMNPPVEERSGGKLLFKGFDTKRHGLQPGDVLVMRSYGRPHPGLVVYRAKDTALNNIVFHNSMGMALLAQRSENIAVNGGGCVIRPGTGRVHTAGADATHFSNTRGLIQVENALYEGMMDDAINVHSTCLGIESIEGPDTLRCKYMHGQAVGFEVFTPGETLRFIAGKTLENGKTAKIKSVRKTDRKHLVITLEKPLPPEVKVGDAVENADWYPAVIFRGNTIRNNRARGSLFTTPESVLVENNLFDHSSGSAILLAGDAQGWYESGRCQKVVIRNNKFLHNLTSRYQFTEAVISIYPEVKQLANQKEYYHANVSITNNLFVTQNVPLLFAISTENILFARNKIQYDDAYGGWNKKPFIFRRCRNVVIRDNKTNRPGWTVENCELDALTPADNVRVNGKAARK